MHVSDPLSTLTLQEPKTPDKLEESGGGGGCIEARVFPEF